VYSVFDFKENIKMSSEAIFNLLKKKGISFTEIMYIVKNNGKTEIHSINSKTICTYLPVKDFYQAFCN
jgi:hypothetical protein